MATQKNMGRKRRRGEGAALDYPEIPGVPMDVIPCFVQALRVATKFFQRANTLPHGVKGVVEEDAARQRSSSSSLHDSLMHRMEAAASETTSSAAITEQEERRHKMDAAVLTWLESVKRFVRRRATTTDESTTTTPKQQEEPRTISVPYACYLYLWDLQQDHDRIPVRRAALYLSGLLLEKSRDCRFHLEQDATLSTWISKTTVEGGVVTPEQPAVAKQQLVLLQTEAAMLLSHLVEEGYARLYPKIGVAAQRIQQLCPNLETFHVSTTSNMNDWRRFRDIALQHGEEEIRRVKRLIERSNVCLEILVPRVGQAAPSVDASGVAEIKDGVVEEEREDDDIDWEDGDDDFEDGSDLMTSNNYNAEHLSAVERTLTLMESSGGLLQGGGLEIDFENPNTSIDNAHDDGPVKNPQALSKLQKRVKLLASRHLPRLTLWLEGLTNADNLVSLMETSSSSLVSLPSSTAQLRSNLVERLSDLKQAISSILSSATRLNLETGEEVNSTALATGAANVVAPRLGGAGNRTRPLISSLQRKPKSRKGRSARIEIKYRPT